MAKYNYVALNQHGNKFSSQLSANNQDELADKLQFANCELIHARQVYVDFRLAASSISRPELISFLFTLERLLVAGVPLITALSDLLSTANSNKLQQIIYDSIYYLNRGYSLAKALASHPEVFDDLILNLVAIGEYSGNLAQILNKIAEYLKWEDEIKTKTGKIILYPIIVAIFSLAASLFLLIFLLPQLQILMLTLNSSEALPWSTMFLFNMARNVHYILLTLVLLCLFTLTIYKILLLNYSMRLKRAYILLRLPLVGSLLHDLSLLKIAQVWSLLDSSGISIIKSVQLCQKICNNTYIAHRLGKIALALESGQPLANAFADPLFPALFQRMVSLGAKTGKMSESLDNIAYFLLRQVDTKLSKMQTLLEPILLLVIGSQIAWVIYAVFTPIYDLIARVQ